MWLGEFVHWWNLVNVVIMCIGVYVHCGFCWWLRIFELGSNCMSYLFVVLIHLMNLYYDNYFGNSNEVRIAYVCVCVCVYIYIYDVWFPLVMMVACLFLEMMNCDCWVKYAKWRKRWVIISLIDVDKWWACVDDLIRDLNMLAMLC